jgi:hypothetical protein
MGAAMSLLHPAAARVARVDDNAVEGCGAIHAVGGTRKRGGGNQGSSGGSGWQRVFLFTAVAAAILFACLGLAVSGSGRGGSGQQRWAQLPLGGKEVGIPMHKRP